MIHQIYSREHGSANNRCARGVRHGDCFPRSASVRDRHFSFYLLYSPLATCSSSSSFHPSDHCLSDLFCMLYVCRALNRYFKTGLCLTFAAVPALFGADDIV